MPVQRSSPAPPIPLLLLWSMLALLASSPAAAADVVVPSQRVPALGYVAIPQFFQYPSDWAEGEASGVDVNSKGHIFLFRRAKPMLSEFDENGRFIKAFDDRLFDHPHGLRIDRDDNIWVTDDTNHTVLKLDGAGTVLLVLGRRFTGGEGDWVFNKPADIGFSDQGDVFVADGYGNSRIVKFDKYGNFIKSWGKYGSEPGEFVLPHSVVVDKQGRVLVGDRENGRIQIFDSDGNFLDQWTGIGYPYGLYMASDGNIWMVDGGFDRVIELDSSGKIVGAFGSPGHRPGQFAWAHFMAMGKDRKIFVADVLNWRFQAFKPTTSAAGFAEYVPSERKYWDYGKSDGFSFRSPVPSSKK